MKTKALLKFALLFFFVILFGCDQDVVGVTDLLDTTEQTVSDNGITFQRKSFDYFPELEGLYEETITKQKKAAKNDPNHTSKGYDFEVDKSRVTELSLNGNRFYTMPVLEPEREDHSFYNVVICDYQDNDREPEAYLMGYFPDEQYIKGLETGETTHFTGERSAQILDYQKLISSRSCYTVSIPMCDYGGAGHNRGENCTEANFYVQTYVVCVFGGDGTGGGSTLPGSPGSDEGPSGGGSGGTATIGGLDGPNILTEPIAIFNLPNHNRLRSELAITDKEVLHYLWANPVVVEKYLGFLERTSFSTQAKAFAKEAIKVSTYGTKDQKDFVTALLANDLNTANNILLKGAKYSSYPYNCPNPPCEYNEDDVAEAMAILTVEIANSFYDGVINLFSMWLNGVADMGNGNDRDGKLVRAIANGSGISIPSDIDDRTLSILFKVRSRDRVLTVEPANDGFADNFFDFGMSFVDVVLVASPGKTGTGFFFAKVGAGKASAVTVSDFFKKLKRISETTLKGGRGHKSFEAFKKAEGKASSGNALHHIVEQNGFKGLNQLKFGKTNIHNTKNIIEIPDDAGELHKRVTGYYNSIDDRFSETKRVREWLADKDFQFQYDFGIARLKELGWDGVTGIIK